MILSSGAGSAQAENCTNPEHRQGVLANCLAPWLKRSLGPAEVCSAHPRSTPAPFSCPHFAGAPSPAPQQQRPVASLRGLPQLRQASVLTDRRHVLTQDEEGSVQLWDITAGGRQLCLL